MKLLRAAIFIALAPLVAILMVFMFVVNVDWWFGTQRKQEAFDLWRNLWKWVQG